MTMKMIAVRRFMEITLFTKVMHMIGTTMSNITMDFNKMIIKMIDIQR